MRLSLVAFALGIAPVSLAASDPVTLPSGQAAHLYELVAEDHAVRFRFVAPELRGALERLSYEALEADLAMLCETVALTALNGDLPAQIVISLSEAPTTLGDPAPDVAQVFEAYRPEGNRCEWEAY